MIPSDHFVRFYNEVFKFLDEKGGLQDYYVHIGHHQMLHCADEFKKNGIRGVYNYYQKIYKEENCQGEVVISPDGHEIKLWMSKCPSLSKALDNDAGACSKYCLHCPGWTAYVYSQCGLFQVYDLMGLDNPQCCEWIYDNREMAIKKYRELSAGREKGAVVTNFQID